jgi:hypothetical protein
MIVRPLEENTLRKNKMQSLDINPFCCWDGERDIKKYIHARNHRLKKYGPVDTSNYLDAVNDVENNGYAVIKNFIDIDILKIVKDSFDAIKQKGQLQYNDNYTEQVGHPLLTCPGVTDVAFNDEVIKLAKTFFGCMPVINNAQLRKSKATTLHENNLSGNGQTTRWHCDKDSPRFLKFFFYLTDVEIENGPFTYVKGSHKEKFDNWKSKYRWSDEEILSKFGEDRIISLCANVGDLIIANTNGFHKGKKVESGERILLTIYTGVHPTEWSKMGGKIGIDDYNKLSEFKKPIAGFLKKEKK